MNMIEREVLEKLGAAIYIHRRLMKTAQEASEAVEYFRKLGIL